MKSIVSLFVCFCLLACSVDDIETLESENNSITTTHKHASSKSIVVRFNDQLSDAEKATIRALYGVNSYETCSCGDPNLESWVFPPSLPLSELEERVRSAKSESGMEGADFNFSVQLSGLDFNPIFEQPFAQFHPLKPDHIQFNAGSSKRSSTRNGPVIGIIDSGIDASNPEFDQNFLYNSEMHDANCIDSNGAPDTFGWNFTNATNNPFDDVGHGTKVSYFIYNQLIGNDITDAKLLPAKAFNNEGGTLFNVSCAFSYLIQKNVDIINMSFGFRSPSSVFESYLEDAKKQRILIIASAGNTGANNDTLKHYPSNYTLQFPHIISVAVVNSQFQLEPYLSNHGYQTVDTAVHAVNIVYSDANGPHHITGSSYAAALTSGAAAVLLSSDIPAEQLKYFLLNNVIPVEHLAAKIREGGYLNLVVY